MASIRRYDMDFQVPLRHRVRFTQDVLGSDDSALLEVLEPHNEPVRVMLVVDDGLVGANGGVARRLEALVQRHVPRIDQAGPVVLVKSGEASKNDPAVIDDLLTCFNEQNLDRRNYVLVAGGGAVLDAVGFATAVAHRGLRLIRLPTTTLAQADSGIGVKNAVNLFGKKNWKGTFAVPWAVINDARLLETLGDRDFRCGFSEAIKVALLKEVDFFDCLCEQAPLLARRDPVACGYAIERSAYWHLMHITRGGDPFEMLEARPLDFGHWLAHRLEALSGFTLRHGEAVAVGLAVDCAYSSMVHGLSLAYAHRVIDFFKHLRVPLSHPLLVQPESLLLGLEEFRQHLGGRLTITMLRAPGCPIDIHEIDPAAMKEAIRVVGGGGPWRA